VRKSGTTWIVIAGTISFLGCGRLDYDGVVRLSIESAPNGDGVEIATQDLMEGERIELYSVLRDLEGGFVDNAAARWSLSGDSVGTVDDILSSRLILVGATSGEARIIAELDGSSDEAGIRVMPCSSCSAAAAAPLSGTVTVSPPAALVGEDVTFSLDPRGESGTVEARWDFDGDGVWDVPFSVDALSVVRSFPSTGDLNVTVEFRDSVQAARLAVSVLVTDVALTVTTSADEVDSGATSDAPLGTGLSLREALLLAAQNPGPDVIRFAEPMTISIPDTLFISGQDTYVIGAPGVVIDGSPGNGYCVEIDGVNGHMSGLTVQNCGSYAVFVKGVDAEISSNVLRTGSDGVLNHGVGTSLRNNELYGYSGRPGQSTTPIVVVGNRFHDNGDGLLFTSGASGSIFARNTVWKHSINGVQAGASSSRIAFWNNTFADSGETGGDAAIRLATNSADIDVRNNIFYRNTLALGGRDSAMGALDYNLYFENGVDCDNCTPGSSALFQNPLLTFDGSTYQLAPSSPAIDSGTVIESDELGGYLGAEPDLGAVEVR